MQMTGGNPAFRYRLDGIAAMTRLTFGFFFFYDYDRCDPP